MKIFNTENDVEKVYVQMDDLMMLSQTKDEIPTSIYEKVLIGDINKMDFIKFSEDEELEYFKNVDWIVDYKEIRRLTEKEIYTNYQKLSNKTKEIVNRFSTMTDDDKIKHQGLVLSCDLLKYQMKSLAEILLIKQGREHLLLPLVVDSDGFSFIGDEKCDYQIKASIDPNKLLLFRKDGKELTMDEKIPQDFYQTGMTIAMIQRRKVDNFNSKYLISNSFSYDKKYLISEFKTKEDVLEEKSFRKLVKKIFGTNK